MKSVKKQIKYEIRTEIFGKVMHLYNYWKIPNGLNQMSNNVNLVTSSFVTIGHHFMEFKGWKNYSYWLRSIG